MQDGMQEFQAYIIHDSVQRLALLATDYTVGGNVARRHNKHHCRTVEAAAI